MTCECFSEELEQPTREVFVLAMTEDYRQMSDFRSILEMMPDEHCMVEPFIESQGDLQLGHEPWDGQGCIASIVISDHPSWLSIYSYIIHMAISYLMGKFSILASIDGPAHVCRHFMSKKSSQSVQHH